MNCSYRSKLEESVARLLGDQWGYETDSLQYHIPKNYKPDFVLKDEDLRVFVEVKGWFRPGDTLKYKHIKQKCDKKGIEFIMILQLPTKKVRKGSETTMAQWCDKNNIRWFSAHNAWKLRKEYEDDYDL